MTLLAVISLAATGAAPLTVIAGGTTTGWLVTGVLGIPVAYAAIVIPVGRRGELRAGEGMALKP